MKQVKVLCLNSSFSRQTHEVPGHQNAAHCGAHGDRKEIGDEAHSIRREGERKQGRTDAALVAVGSETVEANWINGESSCSAEEGRTPERTSPQPSILPSTPKRRRNA